MELIFEISEEGQHAYSLPQDHKEFTQYLPPESLLRQDPLLLPEVSEINLMRHFIKLSQRNFGIGNGFYPLGSCTMKYNPFINETLAKISNFTRCHPLAPEESVQGCLHIIHETISLLLEICGMAAGSLVPNAGSQGEFTSIKMIAAYHQQHGDLKRTEIIIPDNAHGTNPATATMCGFTTVPVKTNQQGDLDLEMLARVTTEKTAALMLTNPNTLGLFSPHIVEIAEIIHRKGGLLFYDGANLNAILNIIRPGEMGFDVMHINLHKTFSTPHGGGGPGSGPILCNQKLAPFLPIPKIVREGEKYRVDSKEHDSMGRISTFFGNFGIYLRAYLYLKLHGNYGLRRIAENAVLNANYLKHHLSSLFTIPYPQYCMHEFVVQADKYLPQGIRALDIAKRLLDYGIHAPTIYFPLIIKECMLIEPTESESKATLDSFIQAMLHIVQEIRETPDLVRTAPHTTAVSRLDEVRAAKHPILKYLK